MAVKTSLHANHLPDNLHGIRTAIENAVPHGRTDNGGKNDRGAWSDAPAHHLGVWAKMEPAYQAIIEKYPKLNHVQRVNHLGTLDTGNHFIEVCLGDEHHKSYSTQYAYDIYLKKWILPRWRSYRLSEVKAVDVESGLKTLPLARGSRAKIRNLMSALFSHAI